MKTDYLTKWMILLLFSLCSTAVFAGNDGIAGTDDDGEEVCECVNGELECVQAKCISVYFSTGSMRNHTDVPSGTIGFMSETPSPTHSTLQALKVVTGLYGILRVTGNEVDVLNRNRKKITFAFPEGGAEAAPIDTDSTWHASLKMVDAMGVPTTSNPVYYDLYTFNGLERVRFDADIKSDNYLRMVNLRTEDGQVYESNELGMRYIYDQEGVIRQAMAPTRMMDFVVKTPYKYEVRYYEPQDVTLGTNGLYEVMDNAQPFETWTVENPDGAHSYNLVNISRTAGGTTRTTSFIYDFNLHMWSATDDGGETWEKTTLEWDASQINGVRTKSWLSEGEAPVAKWKKELINYPWGRAVVKEENYTSATTAQTTLFTYYQDAADTSRYTRVHTEQHGDGTWDVYDYDLLGRKTQQISSWKDVTLTTNPDQAKAVVYDYTPHESSDVPLEYDERPRTVTESIEGIVTKKTFYTYMTNSIGAQVRITEQCASASASYGDVANLRTIKTYYPPCDGTANPQAWLEQGRVKTVEYPDGRLGSYEYALGDLNMDYITPSSSAFVADFDGLDWRVTVTEGTVDSPKGIANQSTRIVIVKDARSNVALEETYVYTGAGYERIHSSVSQFDVHGHTLETWTSDGTQESGYWGSSCCGMDNDTAVDGTQTVYTYDLNKQLISSSRVTHDGAPGLTTDFTYDAAGRKTSTSKHAAGITPLTTQTEYDMIGRLLWKKREDGTIKTWEYDDDAQTITTTQAGGATIITAMYGDRQIKSQTGTAKIHTAYSHVVNSDGTQCSATYTGPDGIHSAVWEKVTTDFLGRIVTVEKPGFGGAVLLDELLYNAQGYLKKTVQSSITSSGSDVLGTTFYEYDALGALIRKTADLNDNGQLELAIDRVTETDSYYEQVGTDFWKVNRSGVYAEEDSTALLTTKEQRVRLTGLGTQSDKGALVSESVVVDRLGNQTLNRTYIDRDNKTVMTITDVPDSTMDAVSVTVNKMLQSQTSKSGVMAEYQYDGLGRRIAGSSDSDGGDRSVGQTIHYNELGQVDWTEDAASNRTSIGYESDTGLKSAMTNALGQTTLYSYTDRGQLHIVGGTSQYPVKYGYDEYGRQTDLYTLRNVTNGWDRTQWVFDQSTGLLLQKKSADGKGPTYSYTPKGKLQTRTWARGIVTSYEYDFMGQLTHTSYSDDTPSVEVAYNRLGHKTQVIDASGTNAFTYSDNLLLTNETQLGSFDLSHTYDELGRSTGYALADGASSPSSVGYGYDELGRFSSVQSESGAVQYAYLDGSARISGYTTDGGVSVSYDYEKNR